MKYLIDTNIFIPLEPTGIDDLEDGTPAVTEFSRLAAESNQQLYVHPESLRDIGRDRQATRQRLRQVLYRKYPELPDPPRIPVSMEQLLGKVEEDSHDWVDHHLLAALRADAVAFLVTEDSRIHKKAARLGLSSSVLNVKAATSMLRRFFDQSPHPPPAVTATKAHNLDLDDPIWEGLRQDYSGFDGWLAKCRQEHRNVWYVTFDNGPYAAVCIINKETESIGLEGKVLKVCTFKVSEDFQGRRLGELLLKAVFDYATANAYDWVYVEAFAEKQPRLISLLSDFGFEDLQRNNASGEVRLAKPMQPTQADFESMDPLAFNKRFGPFVMKIKGAPVFMIPIQAQYHKMLFPEAERQFSFFPGRDSFGNGIRKAYLCNAVIRKITPGSAIIFYRSGDLKAATIVGIVEETLVSSSVTEVAKFVGKRTVYSFSQIGRLCQKTVLAVNFRQVRVLDSPIPLKTLIANGVLVAAPQSIVQIGEKGTKWFQVQLSKQFCCQ